MSMNLGNSSGADDVIVDINTTPLIDVMLVLLIMLIITIPMQTHAVKLNMPIAAVQPPPNPPAVIRVDVEVDGAVFWNGKVLADRGDLETHLRAITSVLDQPEVHLRPHKRVRYEHVAMILSAAQRLGVKKLGVIGNEQFAD